MIVRNYLFVLLCMLSLLSSCQPRSLPAQGLAAYVADPAHKLRQVQQVGEFEIGVTYQPVDLLAARELPQFGTRRAALDSLRDKYRNSTFFLLSIARNGHEVLQPGEGFSQYSDLLQTLSFRMSDYVRLVTSQGDTLRPTNYYLDRTYASAGTSQLLFAFPALPATGTWRFQLRECGLGTGNLAFSFDTQRVYEVPVLALN